MTAYFDAKQTELRAIRKADMQALEDFERQIIQDVANVGELLRAKDEKGRLESAAFPEDLRDAAYRLLLQYSPVAWPSGLKYSGPDYEDTTAHHRGLSSMLEGLHDLLHEAARRGWAGGDTIKHPILEAGARMEERCYQFAVAAGAQRYKWASQHEEELAAEIAKNSAKSEGGDT